MIHLSAQDCELLNHVQKNFPLDSHPFATIGRQVGMTEDAVIRRLQELEEGGAISRFGAVFKPNVAGASTLVAVAVPENAIEKTASLINALPGVNHNYLREHQYNMWFVITGQNRKELDDRLQHIQSATQFPMLDLPMEQPYHIDLGFSL
jgi:DNA-binding Lrp family transcriptional regulator